MASAGIRKTPTGRYKVWWRQDDASQGSQTFDTRDQARDFKHALLARLARGSWTCTTSPPTTVRTTRSCWPSRWPAMWPSTRPRPPGPWASPSTTASAKLSWRIWTCRPVWLSSSGPVGSWAPARSWRAAAAEVGAHAWLRWPLLDQEPPLLHHPGAAAGPGRLRHPPPRRPHPPVGRVGRPEDEQAVVVVASWSHVGSGYQTKGEAWLAASPAARAREARPIAREELRTRTIAA